MTSPLARFAWLVPLASAVFAPSTVASEPATHAADHAVTESLRRLDRTISDHPSSRDAVLRYLNSIHSRRPGEFVRLADELEVDGLEADMASLVVDPAHTDAASHAARLLIESGQAARLRSVLDQDDENVVLAAIAAIASVRDFRGSDLLLPLLGDDSRSLSIRSAAARALGSTWHGQQRLLGKASAGEVPDAVRFEISDTLLGSASPEIAAAAAKIPSLSLAPSAESEPLPPISQLVTIDSDPSRGKVVYNTVGTCNQCHKVNGEGNEVGPDLSEIGSKLSREDLFVSILNPSAGISHNYETYSALTVDGSLVRGLLVSQTADEVSIRTADAKLVRIPADDLERLDKQDISLMPADLQKVMTVQNLVDLVEYLRYLKTPDQARYIDLATGPPSHDPSGATDSMDVAEDLSVQLYAYEPKLFSPAAIDVDHLGRVWVCEVVNYRNFRNPGNQPRTAGDRILVLEDTNGDGSADRSTVFYQGRDIDSPHGVCVLGDRVLVSAGAFIYDFRDHDGDLVADEKRVLFSGIGGVQHDHGIHSVMPGPDGKLYFNFGNEGKQICDADGDPIIDQFGRPVVTDGSPYQEGMVFRCDPDGSNVETLGWNFRNPWEVAVDSFGTLWQSDNDDDGNRGTRINYVMPFGNYGYRSEITGAGWRERRIGMQAETELRHWHLNDPGVVPNLLQTGAGSPTGMMIYEGELLPDRFHGQILHTDPGPGAVRAYPVEPDGAGYSATIENLIAGSRDPWFRPVDVCVAPDGSLIVADWYDPGVGGHRMGDTKRGRIFRITVSGRETYRSPVTRFDTPTAALTSLHSPNQSTRFLAAEALVRFWNADTPRIETLLDPAIVVSPRHRARLLWVLARVDSLAEAAIRVALADPGVPVRVAAIRAAVQSGTIATEALFDRMRDDPHRHVWRELVLALVRSDSPEVPRMWAELAMRHDGRDRWYLEALGIAARGRWDDCFAAWKSAVGDGWNTASGRDIVWRSRASASCPLLAELIMTATSVAEQQRYFRALDFQPDRVAVGEALERIAGLQL